MRIFKRPSKKQLKISLLIIILLITVLGFWVNYNSHRMANRAAPFIYSDIQAVPNMQAAVVLGTSKFLSGGYINGFYAARIIAAVALFKAGKVKAIIVSGDNRKKNYDEPTTMRDDLVANGVPSQYITLDYAGFRTLDSIVRAKQIFDLDDYILVSQKFHLERAIYLSDLGKQFRTFTGALICQDDVDQMQRRKSCQQAEERDVGILQESNIDHDHRHQRQGEMAHMFVVRQGRRQGDEGHVDRVGQPPRHHEIEPHGFFIGQRLVVDLYHNHVAVEPVRDV